MRRPYAYGTWVLWKGSRYQVEIDYEDWVYFIGVKDPVLADELKLA